LETNEFMRIEKNTAKRIYLFLIATIFIIFAVYLMNYGVSIENLGIASFVSALPSIAYIYAIKPGLKKLKIAEFEE